MVPKCIGETLSRATIKLKECRNVRIDKIIKIGMFKQALCKKVMSTLSKGFMGTDILSV